MHGGPPPPDDCSESPLSPACIAHYVVQFGGLVVVGVSNVVAWFSSIDVGATVSAISVLSIALVGAVVAGMSKIGQSYVDLKIKMARAQAEADEIQKSSLTYKIEQLTGNCDHMAKRVEDANRKLHDAANREHRYELQCTVLSQDIDDARKQLAEANRQLSELNGRIAALTAELHAAHAENQRLATLADVVGKNSDEIDRIKDTLIQAGSGESPAAPPQPPAPASYGDVPDHEGGPRA